MFNGADLRSARERAGISLNGMARQAHFTKSYLSVVETGKRPVTAEVVAAYKHVLGVPLAPPPADPVRAAHEWLLTESPVAEQVRSGRRVGSSLADELEHRVVELRHLDDTVSSGELGPVVANELCEVQRVVADASFAEPVGHRLFAVVAELAQLAGWVASDAGRYRQAEFYYLSGVEAANEARDAVLGAQLLSSLSYQMANVGSPQDAALVARTATVGAAGATPMVRTLFLERVAWASAKAGQHDLTRRTLDQVDETYELRGPPEPEWVYWLDREEIDVMAGRCLIGLGRPTEAEPLLSSAIANYPPEHARETALYLSWLAESHARAGNTDAARETLCLARQHAGTMPSARADARLATIERMLA